LGSGREVNRDFGQVPSKKSKKGLIEGAKSITGNLDKGELSQLGR